MIHGIIHNNYERYNTMITQKKYNMIIAELYWHRPIYQPVASKVIK